jgi:hypothetical protein
MWRRLVGGRRLLFIVGRVPVLLSHRLVALIYKGAASGLVNETPATGSALARLQRSPATYAGSRFSMAVPEQIFAGCDHAKTRGASRPGDMGW